MRLPAPLISICFLTLMISLGAGAAAGTIDPRLEAALAASGGGEVTVIVALEGKADLGKIGRFTPADKAGYRRRMIEALQSHAAGRRAMLEGWMRAKGIAPGRPLWLINSLALTAPAAAISAMASVPGVAAIRLDEKFSLPAPAKPAQSIQGNIAVTNADLVWAKGFNGKGVVVAEMDSGVDYQHADLSGRWRGGANSWLDTYDTSGKHTTPYDPGGIAEAGHGTAVMGIMVGGSATGTSIGMAPGAKWIAAKIYDDKGNGDASHAHLGFQWLLDPDGNPATDDAPDVVNNSWDLETYPNQYKAEFRPDVQALKAAGIAVVFAGGNTGDPTESNVQHPYTSVSPANYPESFSVGSIMFVAATGTFQMAPSSGAGPLPAALGGGIYPLLAAPGMNILCAALTGGGANKKATVYMSGTSIAAPHVAGAMALLLSAYPHATPPQLESALKQSAYDLGPKGPDNSYGYGMLDVLAAYNKLKAILAQNAVDGAWMRAE